MFDYSKLRGKIAEKFKSKHALYPHLSYSASAFERKIHNFTEFKQSEILDLCSLLGISVDEIPDYFFASEYVKSHLSTEANEK